MQHIVIVPDDNANELLALVVKLDGELRAFAEIDEHDAYALVQQHRRIDSTALAICAAPITSREACQLLLLAATYYRAGQPLESCGQVGQALAKASLTAALDLAPLADRSIR